MIRDKWKAGGLYAAIAGLRVDGHDFINHAIEVGATTIVCEKYPSELKDEVTYVKVEDAAAAIGQIANSFYGEPSRQMQVVGITGTNGKTSTATLLYNLYQKLGYKTGLISTIENRIHTTVEQARFTTPDAISLHSLLARMYEAGCDYVFMEVSSHAIVQQRIAGLQLAGAVFTNITHDHLDFHGDFKSYIAAKKELFDNLPNTAFALVNTDDKNAKVMLQNCAARPYAFALHRMADFRARLLESSLSGLTLSIEEQQISSPLIGAFNAYNLLAAYGVAQLLGASAEDVLVTLSALAAPAGRFEQIQPAGQSVTGVVDYAHTPDALEKVLLTIQPVAAIENRQVVTVVGCGGDRDKSKRPQMAAIAARHSDTAVFTSDNPRSEDPQQILADMMTGLEAADMKKVLVISDRREAIRTAVRLSQPNGIVLVAGKGHETYQEIQNQRLPFDDRLELSIALQEYVTQFS